MTARRANPEQTLRSILNATDRADALARLTAALSRTWQAGFSAGWDDGVSDATEDEPTHHANPYWSA